jgi:NAD(P)H-nitrite reductase large subunit
MANVFGNQVGQLLRKLHENSGTQFRFEQHVRRLIGEGYVKAVELDDGSQLPADLVVVGIGVRPNTHIVQMYPKNPDAGIDVDQYLRLNEHVFAAGDIACYPDRYSGERIRVEHWRVAQQQGRAAARNMVGPCLPYDAVPFFWTRQFGVSLTHAGHAGQWDDVIFTGEPEEMDFSAYYVKDDQLLAVAGTQTEQTIRFMEQMRSGRLPAPDRLRDRQSLASTG